MRGEREGAKFRGVRVMAPDLGVGGYTNVSE